MTSAEDVRQLRPAPAGLDRLRYLWWRIQTWATTNLGAVAWEARAAWWDVRRTPRLSMLLALLLLWAMAMFTPFPLLIAGGAWLVAELVIIALDLVTWMRPRTRRRLRRLARFVAFCVLVGVLGFSVPWWGWLAGAGLVVAAVALSATPRARNRLLRGLLVGLAAHTGTERKRWKVLAVQWDEHAPRRLVAADIAYPPELRPAEPGRRERVGQTLSYALRHAGAYSVQWPETRAVIELRAAPELPAFVEAQHWPPGMPAVPLGVTDVDTADLVIRDPDGQHGDLPVALHDPSRERDLLVVGVKGGGKTVFVRGYVASGLRAGFWGEGAWLFDGKGGGDYAALEGRVGVVGLYRHPDAWRDNLRRLRDEMRDRYEADYQWQAGRAPRPGFQDRLIVLEELQAILAALPDEEGKAIVREFGRMARGAKYRLVVITQRPDSKDAIPGDLKDQLEDRVVCGFLSPIGAKMALDKDAHVVEDQYGAEMPRGRAIARIGGQIKRLQIPYLESPVMRPDHEQFYPPIVPPAPKAKPTEPEAGRPNLRPVPDQAPAGSSAPSDTDEMDTPAPGGGSRRRRPKRTS